MLPNNLRKNADELLICTINHDIENENEIEPGASPRREYLESPLKAETSLTENSENPQKDQIGTVMHKVDELDEESDEDSISVATGKKFKNKSAHNLL